MPRVLNFGFLKPTLADGALVAVMFCVIVAFLSVGRVLEG